MGKRSVIFLHLLIAISFYNSIFGSPLIFHLCSLSLILWSIQLKAKLLKWEFYTLCLLPLFIIQSIFKTDITAILHINSYILTIIAYSRIGRCISYDYKNIPFFYLKYLVLPILVLYSLFHFPIQGKSYAALSLIDYLFPSSINEYTVHIGTPNFTKHFTGELGLILVITSLLFYVEKRKKLYMLMTIFSIYLLLFSGARTGFITFLISSTLFFINYKNTRIVLSLLIVCTTIILFYSINSVIDIITPYIPVDSFLGGLLRLELHDSQYGITSNRDFLWNYHIDLFLKDPLWGVDSSLVRFSIGDVLADGSIAKAGSESFYTAMLAQYGILGIFFPVLHLYLLYNSLNKRMFINMIWIVVFIFSNIFNSTFGNVYGEFMFVYFLMFAKYPQNYK